MTTRDEAQEVLRTLFVDPDAAQARARDELIPAADPVVSSIGHQVLGIVLRDRGLVEEALVELRRSLRLARRSGDRERQADARATIGASLAVAGRVRAGLEQLDRAAREVEGVSRARVLYRRAWILDQMLADFEGSAADLGEATAAFERAGDRMWQAGALNLEGLALARSGDLSGARRAFEESGRVATELGDLSHLATTVHNTGWVGYLAGDLPLAFERYAEAAAIFDEIEMTNVELVVDQCDAYLAGGLADDALMVCERALAARPLQPRERADLLVSVAEAALAAGDTARTVSAADEASRLLRAQGREAHRAGADLLAIAGRLALGGSKARLLRRAERMVDAARSARAPELPQALMLAAELARGARTAGASELADAWLEEASSFRRAAIGTTRALGWLAVAQRRQLAGDSAGVLRSCDRGLDALDVHHATLGSAELRARSSGHGAQLAELGTRTALATGDARRLLVWSERWRATALAVPPVSRQHDPETSAELAALRAQARRLTDATAAGENVAHLRASVARLEGAVRQRLLAARGDGDTARALDVADLLRALAEDDTVLVELTEIDGELHALVAGHGRVRRLDVGDAAAAAAAVDFALFALRGAARGRRSQLDLAGVRLQRALLGSALDHVGDSQVVVSGTSALQGVPWGLLPGLADRPVTSTPSARLWLRARQTSAEAERRVMLVGPGLASGGAEVPAVAAQDPSAEVLDGDDATVEASLAALDGAALAHVAAHGHFREDSPLFSSLVMADGPMLVHDLQQLRRPPHRVVLSACESGELAPVGAQELLGLSAALLSMGTAGIVSSLGEVDDAATVEVMVALHAALRQGHGLGEAMLAARRAAAGDQVLAATAASFTALGV